MLTWLWGIRCVRSTSPLRACSSRPSWMPTYEGCRHSLWKNDSHEWWLPLENFTKTSAIRCDCCNPRSTEGTKIHTTLFTWCSESCDAWLLWVIIWWTGPITCCCLDEAWRIICWTSKSQWACSQRSESRSESCFGLWFWPFPDLKAWFYPFWMQSSFKSGFWNAKKRVLWIMIRLESGWKWLSECDLLLSEQAHCIFPFSHSTSM